MLLEKRTEVSEGPPYSETQTEISVNETSHCVAHNKAKFKGKEKICNPHGTTMNGLLINKKLM